MISVEVIDDTYSQFIQHMDLIVKVSEGGWCCHTICQEFAMFDSIAYACKNLRKKLENMTERFHKYHTMLLEIDQSGATNMSQWELSRVDDWLKNEKEPTETQARIIEEMWEKACG